MLLRSPDGPASDFGIRALDEAGQVAIFDQAEAWAGPRPILADSPEFVQPIPNIVVKDGVKLISYIRSPKSGEVRLHNKVAVGFVGHVDLADMVLYDDLQINLCKTMAKAALRELSEELGITLDGFTLQMFPNLLTYTHVIQSQKAPVDAVHIGFVVTVDLSVLPSCDFNYEDAIADATLMTPAELRRRSNLEGDNRLELETWMGLVIDQLLAEEQELAA